MALSNMTTKIIEMIDEKYPTDSKKECIDIKQVKDLCKIYIEKNSKKTAESVGMEDIEFSSVEMSKISKGIDLTKDKKLGSLEFKKIYALFIKLTYTCLIFDIDIFDKTEKKNNTYYINKNNYQLIKSIEAKKKELITEHISILQKKYKSVSKNTDDSESYKEYVDGFIVKINLLSRMIKRINIFEKNDNLCSMILPYFYIYTDYIEEYVG